MAKMNTGMRMLAMAKATGNGGNRMEGGSGMQMGGYGQMGDMPEMRRRRDSRGRYMEGDQSSQMNMLGGSEARYYPGGTPQNAEGNEMKGRGMRMHEENPLNGVDTQHQPYTHSGREPFSPEEPGRANGNTAKMGGEGYVTWNRMSMNDGPRGNGNSNSYAQGGMQEGNITSMHDYEHKRNGAHDKQRMIGFHQEEEDEEAPRMNREKAEK